MISRNYFVNLLRSHLVLLAVATLFVLLFQVLIPVLIEGIDMLSFMEQLYEQLPPLGRQLFNQQFAARFSVEAAIAFGYNHPMVLTTLFIVAIVLPARHIAGEIESGTLELVLALPVRRLAIGLTLWLASALALMVLLLGCFLGTRLGLAMNPELNVTGLASLGRIGANLWFLAFAVTSYTLWLSSCASEGGAAAMRAAGVTLLFYFMQFAVQIWPAIDFLEPLTIFSYYEPQRLLLEDSSWWRDAAVLGLVAVVTGALGIHHFTRRDIP